MIIEVIPAGPFQTNAYLVVDEATKESIVIDPAPESFGPIERKMEKHRCKLVGIYLTHSHLDHFADAVLLIEKYHIPLYVHVKDAKNVEVPGSDGLPLFIPVRGVKPTGNFQEGDILKVGNLRFTVIETPGHTEGGVSFYFKDEKILFSGDTLFKGAHGRVDFPTADSEKMSVSLHKLAKLPGEIKVYPGHGSATTIENEKEWICP